jgi:hypothetical protein
VRHDWQILSRYLHGLWILDQIIMESSVQTTLGITLVSLLISAAIASAALAQSGSAGGSIGNDEKSLSTTTSTVVVTGGRFSDGVASGTISPNGVSHSVGIYNGGTSRTSGNRGSGTFRTSDGCTGTLTSTKR